MHILIADDDAFYRALLEGFLKEWRFRVTAACNGGEAWEAIQRDRTIKLAILNWMMPVLDGYEICRRLTKAGREDIYTILVIGNRFKGEIVKALIPAANDYLTKPFGPRELKIRLRSAMGAMHVRQRQEEVIPLPPDQQLTPESAVRSGTC